MKFNLKWDFMRWVGGWMGSLILLSHIIIPDIIILRLFEIIKVLIEETVTNFNRIT